MADTPVRDLYERSAAQLPLWAIFMEPTADFVSPLDPAGSDVFREHLAFVVDLEEQGRIFASGPLDLDVEGIRSMCIISAASKEGAEEVAAAEPYHRAGMRTNRVQSWLLNRGLAVQVGMAMVHPPHLSTTPRPDQAT